MTRRISTTSAARPLGVLLLHLLPCALAAQGLGWDVKAEGNGSVFFGNTRQSTLGTRLSAGRSDSTMDVRTNGEFTYGEAEGGGLDGGERRMFVSKRSWRTALTADYRPFARVSPFVLGSIESSFEKRIDRRYNAGGGAKVVFVRNERTTSDFSLAVLAERSLLPDTAGPRIEETLARYSARFRLERKLGERAVTAHETFYRPEVSTPERFTLTSRTSLAYKMTTTLALQASFLDNYDSEARDRGARSNNDGELLFGLAATF
jgi:hypothetical protein